VIEIDEVRLLEQERVFADAFAVHDLERTRPLYQPDVVYLSPTVRLFGWPARVEGVDGTLEFIGLTIGACRRIEYTPREWACLADGRSAFVRLHFDWDQGEARLRSNYVVLYRYRAGRIAQQELYYDPSGRVEQIGPALGSHP
jgi:ketosteroid isomerase-like protein